MNNIAVITFGRMNPPTVGHAKLVDKVRQIARHSGGEPFVFLSHSHDSKKNPLDYATKFKFAKKAFGKVVQGSFSRTIIQALSEVETWGYDEVIVVVGSDRVQEFSTLLKKYNGKDYKFDKIRVMSAGERDPDADDVSGMSASKMREYAEIHDLASFKQGLPPLLHGKAAEVMQAVRTGLNLKESSFDTAFENLQAVYEEDASFVIELMEARSANYSNGHFKKDDSSASYKQWRISITSAAPAISNDGVELQFTLANSYKLTNSNLGLNTASVFIAAMKFLGDYQEKFPTNEIVIKADKNEPKRAKTYEKMLKNTSYFTQGRLHPELDNFRFKEVKEPDNFSDPDKFIFILARK